MNGEELYPEESRSLESLRQMRLTALLRDMIDGDGKVKAAETLGVNYRTLVRAEESGRLTERMANALERHLLLGGGSEAARQRERVEALEEGVKALEERLRSGLEGLRGVIENGVGGLRDEQAQGMRQLERRLAKMETGRGGQEAVEETQEAVEKPAARPAWRPYRDLVTLEPEPGEEQVYGDATPLIVEWRKARADFLKTLRDGTVLRRAAAYERTLELEIEMIGEHELTLPPRTYPWDGPDRRKQLWMRTQALDRVRVERARAQLRRWLRRVLTLGLWRD